MVDLTAVGRGGSGSKDDQRTTDRTKVWSIRSCSSRRAIQDPVRMLPETSRASFTRRLKAARGSRKLGLGQMIVFDFGYIWFWVWV
ncbi:hypothetical protein RHMOL_Rhmol06G0282500 [Rhododendron molle]|uniref:Uncharacterized protein n=1 Tax=Rhododendron molle TaxID=49168 RepID=A0ACC0NH18_RHOML|nr:hypothetical protein RHMOL_Rhmol06G0282500 [Rhododendron molle]